MTGHQAQRVSEKQPIGGPMSSSALTEFSGGLKKMWSLAQRVAKQSKEDPAAQLFNFLTQQQLDLSPENYSELGLLLAIQVNINDHSVKSVWSNLYNFVQKYQEDIKTNALNDKSAVAEFLVEALRCVNFACHNSDKIKYFITLIKGCGISIDGEPDQCMSLATFGTLQFNTTSKKIMMSP
ncbi:hypothetical protein [Acidiphilium iwatense]|uniref:Uncharacterized protein n=1 Tax=Acidiphilium iwatense TaxID=768198 RepID=A0ABS9DZI5_9PROT|nr:hypothetical protein [Acidiphilium iwatense]MCF3948173.1 hypothetical protein [Acidiphilium iwatense]